MADAAVAPVGSAERRGDGAAGGAVEVPLAPPQSASLTTPQPPSGAVGAPIAPVPPLVALLGVPAPSPALSMASSAVGEGGPDVDASARGSSEMVGPSGAPLVPVTQALRDQVVEALDTSAFHASTPPPVLASLRMGGQSFALRRSVVYLGRERESPLAQLMGWGASLGPGSLLQVEDMAAAAGVGGPPRPSPAATAALMHHVSRRHAAIIHDASTGGFTLINYSKNGTRVNEERVPEGGMVLRDGAIVEIGGIRMTFKIESPSGGGAAAAPATLAGGAP